jgi:hypothetical protein
MSETDSEPTRFDADVWRIGLGTAAGYALILLAMFLLLFVVPYLAFSAL